MVRPFGIALGLLTLHQVIAGFWSLAMVPSTALFALYLAAIWLAGTWAMRLKRREPSAPTNRQFLALLGVLVFATWSREGGGCVRFSYDAYELTTSLSKASDGSRTVVGEPSGLARHGVRCYFSCDSSSDEACSAASDTPCGYPRGSLKVFVDLGIVDPWCYVPLWKQHQVSFVASISIAASQPLEVASLGLSKVVTGSLEVEAIGLVSCHTLRKRIGEIIGASIAEDVDRTIASLP